jgi:hypothetical protein
MEDKKNNKDSKGTILADMLISPENQAADLGGLVVEPEADSDKDSFEKELERTLSQTENEVLNYKDIKNNANEAKSWQTARKIIQDFRPVPWFIWRLSNFVLGTPGQINKVSEGFVLGLRRLIFAAASDSMLGSGEKVNDMRKALKIVNPDIIASASVIHAICRRLATRQFERIWRPILEDALLRCQIGCLVGQYDEKFGAGRGMLAGFSSRCGLAVLLSMGDLDQARRALELLASGQEISEVGLKVFSCNPLQVSAMLLSGSGCGRDAAFGTVGYAFKDSALAIENEEQLKWLAAFTITEDIRVGKSEATDIKMWKAFGLEAPEDREELLKECKKIIRRGHGWSWLL